MNKRIISLAIFAGLFIVVSFASAALPNLGPKDFSTFLWDIAAQVGALVGGIGTIMLVVSGIIFLTSGGSPERMGVAKKALTYAIIGMVVGLSATAIVNFIKGIVK